VSGQTATAPDINNLSNGADTNLSLNAEAKMDVFGGVGAVRAAAQQAAGPERVFVVEVVLAPAGVARLGTEAWAASRVVASPAVSPWRKCARANGPGGEAVSVDRPARQGRSSSAKIS
jgi:hypothetical protein